MNRIVAIYYPYCIHCKRPLLPNTLVWCIDKPVLGIVHYYCAPFYNYDGGYPHALPFQDYEKNSRPNNNNKQ